MATKETSLGVPSRKQDGLKKDNGRISFAGRMIMIDVW